MNSKFRSKYSTVLNRKIFFVNDTFKKLEVNYKGGHEKKDINQVGLDIRVLKYIIYRCMVNNTPIDTLIQTNLAIKNYLITGKLIENLVFKPSNLDASIPTFYFNSNIPDNVTKFYIYGIDNCSILDVIDALNLDLSKYMCSKKQIRSKFKKYEIVSEIETFNYIKEYWILFDTVLID